jgi:hypothetical protein
MKYRSTIPYAQFRNRKSSENRKFWPTPLMMQVWGVSQGAYQSLFSPLRVNIYTLRRINSNVFNYGVLPHTPLWILLNTRYMHRIAFLKILKIPNSETCLAGRVSEKELWTCTTIDERRSDITGGTLETLICELNDSQNFLKNQWAASKNSKGQTGNTKQAPYWGSTNIRRHRTKFSHPDLNWI